MRHRLFLATFLLGGVSLLGCNKPKTPSSGLTAPKAYWDKTGHPTIDYWNHVNRACYGHRRLSTDTRSEELLCRMHAKVIRDGSTAGVDPELVDWAHQLADWYDAKAEILAIRNNADFYPHGIRDKRAGRSPTIVEINEAALVEWEVQFQALRSEGIQLRDTLGARTGKPILPCVLDAPR
jgi:hypothetical protein